MLYDTLFFLGCNIFILRKNASTVVACKYVTQRKYDIKTEAKLTEIEINDVRQRSDFMTFFDRKWDFVDIVRSVIWQLGRALVTVAVVKSEVAVVEELHF